MNYLKGICKRIVKVKKTKLSPAAGIPPLPTLRVVVLGPSGVGKSSLMSCFFTGRFDASSGPDAKIVRQTDWILDNSERINLQVVDNASLTSFASAIQRLVTIINSHAFILVFSLDDESSFDAVDELLKKIIEIKGDDNVPVVVVANKVDIAEDKRAVCPIFTDLVVTFDWGVRFVLASAKEGLNVETIFKELPQKL